MIAKIKPWLHWIIVGLTIFVLALIEYLLTYVLNIGSGNHWYYSLTSGTIMPGMEIVSYIISDTITWFGGEEYPFHQFLKTAGVSAAGFIVLFVLGPWFFTKGLLYRKSDNQPSGLMWYFGTTIVVLGIAVSTLFGVRQTIISPNNERIIESNKLVDHLRRYMTNVAFDASEWMILPEEKGGGNGSFISPNGDLLTLDELSSYRSDHPDFELSIEEALSDSIIIVRGSLVNQDIGGEADRHILVEITPMNDSVFKFQRNTAMP